jgi:hypothetical protein
MITSENRLRYGRHDFYPFGVEQTSSVQEETNFGFVGADPMKFTGHERDFQGVTNVENADYVDYMHARYCGVGKVPLCRSGHDSRDYAVPATLESICLCRRSPDEQNRSDRKDTPVLRNV